MASKRSEIRAFEAELVMGLRRALPELRRRIGDERPYAFALYTSHQDEYLYVCASANTQEALDRRVAEYVRRGHVADLRGLRWNAADWGYHDFSPEVACLEVPPHEEGAEADAVYAAFVAALKALDREKGFGTGRAREKVVLNVLCGDMGKAFFERGLRALNPRSVVERYFESQTPRAFIRRINALPASERRRQWLALYEVLAVGTGGADESVLLDARAVGLTDCDVEEQLAAVGPRVVSPLILLLRRLSAAPTFNDPGSQAAKRDGAFTRENVLASRIAFLIGAIGNVDDRHISHLQAIVREVEERDRSRRMASPLAENVARVLHELRPRRFPDTELDPRTNHLRNPGPFVGR